MLYLPFITRSKLFNQLYITNKTELFSFKSGHFITKILECKVGLNRRIKFACVAMCSLVMSLCSRDLLVMSLRTIIIH